MLHAAEIKSRVVAGLSLRQKRIVYKVLREMECAISIPNARSALEAKNSSNSIQLGNPDLGPIAFAMKYADGEPYVFGSRRTHTAWLLFFPVGVLILLTIIGILVMALYEVFSGRVGLFLVLIICGGLSLLIKWLAWIVHKFERERWVARRLYRDAYGKLGADERAPILYLRSFSFDSPIYELPLEVVRTLDERIAEYYEQYGPVIAVAGPDDKGPMAGPARLYFGDDIWRAGVTYLMSISQLVIILAGISQGTLWEIGMARRLLEPEKLIICVADAFNSNVADGYYYFKPYAEVMLGCELPKTPDSSLLIRFGKNWKPLI